MSIRPSSWTSRRAERGGGPPLSAPLRARPVLRFRPVPERPHRRHVSFSHRLRTVPHLRGPARAQLCPRDLLHAGRLLGLPDRPLARHGSSELLGLRPPSRACRRTSRRPRVAPPFSAPCPARP